MSINTSLLCAGTASAWSIPYNFLRGAYSVGGVIPLIKRLDSLQLGKGIHILLFLYPQISLEATTKREISTR